MHRTSWNHRIVLMVALVAAATGAHAADKWTYTHFTASGRSIGTGVLELSEGAGGATVSMASYHEYADPCYAKGKLKATVLREADMIVITLQDLQRGCTPFRLKIRGDGTGGQQEVLLNGEWVSDKLEHGLVRK